MFISTWCALKRERKPNENPYRAEQYKKCLRACIVDVTCYQHCCLYFTYNIHTYIRRSSSLNISFSLFKELYTNNFSFLFTKKKIFSTHTQRQFTLKYINFMFFLPPSSFLCVCVQSNVSNTHTQSKKQYILTHGHIKLFPFFLCRLFVIDERI